ncbi:MAG TPA: serine hydrolase domain-containing protein [Mycobacteriales bacterium]|nr:serine hydrolase domain-containing protein [Mycobacteriales bacterium]
MTASTQSELAVTGFTASGFEPVADAMGELHNLWPGGAGFAAYVDGELVVDLAAGFARDGIPWRQDTVTLIASVTKGLAAMCLQLLEDRGQLDLDEKVAAYWPEFAQNGKQDITVRQVQLHTTGVIGLSPQPRVVHWDGRGWDDLDAIADSLARVAPAWEPGTRYGYHAVTYGWLAGELVRRITGRTLGRFFETEIAEPLDADVHIGSGPDVIARTAEVYEFRANDSPLSERIAARLMFGRMRNNPLLSQAFLSDGTDSIASASIRMLKANDRYLAAEVPAANGLATAKGLARVFSVLATGGEVDGLRLLSTESVKRWSAPVQRLPDYTITSAIPFARLLRIEERSKLGRTVGYLTNHPPGKLAKGFGPNDAAVGSEGAGGQVAFADPVRRVSAGFVRSQLWPNRKASDHVVAALYKCLG